MTTANVEMKAEEMDSFAREIAMETARVSIERHAPRVGKNDEFWLDTAEVAEGAAEWIGCCEVYLEALGALERHPDSPWLVRFRRNSPLPTAA